MTLKKIQQGIASFELSKNRMEVEKIKGITLINDCYNANFDSMKAAMETLAKMEGKRKIAILGDMLELGDFSKKLHDKVGIEVAKNKIDVLITVGEEAKQIASAAIRSEMNPNNVYMFEKNEEAIKMIKTMMEEGDVLLIKASNGMKFIEIVNSLKEKLKQPIE